MSRRSRTDCDSGMRGMERSIAGSAVASLATCGSCLLQHAKLKNVIGVVPELQLLPVQAGEVDDHLAALGRKQHQVAQLDRRLQQAEIRADLVEGAIRRQSVRWKKRPFAAFSSRNRYWRGCTSRYGKDLAVADDCVAVELRHERRARRRGDRVQQLTVTIESAVIDQRAEYRRRRPAG